MQVSFDRDNKGKLQKNSNILSILYARDAYLLEDELNEAQWNIIESQANSLRSQYTSGILNTINLVQVDSNNAYLESEDGQPLTVIVDGYVIKIGGNKAKNLLSLDNRILFDPTPVASNNDKYYHYFEFWFEIVSYSQTLRKFGGEDTEVIENNLWDDRVKKETSRRVQMKWRIKNSQDLNFSDFDKVEDGLWKKVEEPTYNPTNKALTNLGVTYRMVFAKGTDSFNGYAEIYNPVKASLKDNNVKRNLTDQLVLSDEWQEFKEKIENLEKNVLGEDLKEKLENLEASLNSKIAGVETNLDVRLTDLENDLETNLNVRLTDLETNLRDQLITINELIENQAKSIEEINTNIKNSNEKITSMTKEINRLQVQLDLNSRVPENNGTFSDLFDGSKNKLLIEDASSDIIEDIPAGTSVLLVSNTDGFKIGMQVTIFDDESYEEAMIVAIGDGTITVEPALKSPYKKGAKVVRSSVDIDLTESVMKTGSWKTYEVTVIEII